MQATAIGPATFRQQFPLLKDTVHLAACSLAPHSAIFEAAMHRMLAVLRADPTPWDLWLAEVEQSRDRFAALVNASPAEVAVVPSASIGAYQVASTLDWGRRPGIVTTDGEYSSVAQIWLAQRPRGARVTSVPDPTGDVPVDDYLAAIDERTALVSMPVISYRTGALMPVAQVVRRAHEVGARVFVDAYQVAGVLPVDVAGLGCDYLVSGTMKYLLGIPGIAYLYARAGLTDDLSPQLTGWYGRGAALSFDPQALDFPDDARRFQMNMPTLPAALAANAGLGLIGSLDLDAVRRHVYGLVDRTLDRLAEAGAPVYSPTAADIRGPHVAVLDDDPMKLAAWLNARRIFPARGHVVRMSFHYYNDESDVDTACDALAEYRGSR